MKRYILMLFAVPAVRCLVAACGSDDGGSGGWPAPRRPGPPKGAKAIDPASMDSAKGEVTYCTGKDTSGAQVKAVKQFNKEFGDQGLSAKLLEFPESADEQRNQFIQRQRAKSGDCDIFYSDVIWTAEFASQKWLSTWRPTCSSARASSSPRRSRPVNFDGKFCGVPQADRRRLPLLPQGQGRDGARDVAGRSTRTPPPRTASSTRARPTRA